MKIPQKPVDEDERMSVLNELNIIYTPAEERFDRITRLAKLIFKVPIAVISLVADDIQYFKSIQGLDTCETSREVSFCGHAILGNDTFIVPDTLKAPDFADNPLVVNEPHIRFYAGEPIALDSQNLGTLCLIDYEPREFSEVDKETLKSLARMVENELKLTLYTQPQKEILGEMNDVERKLLLDPVTGCWNGKGFDLLLDKKLNKSNQTDNPVSILLLEVEWDNEQDKSLSDHDRNTVIKECAQRIRNSVGTKDIIGRLRDKQFILFLNNCDKFQCRSITQKIQRNISMWHYELDDESLTLSVKIGTTSSTRSGNWSKTSLLDAVKVDLETAIDE